MAVVLYTVVYTAYQVVYYPFGGYPWTLDEINKQFEVPVPQDATDIQYSGHTGLGAHLDLEFKAPSASAELFASSICNGGLYAGYDPYNAINIGEPFTYTHPMRVSLFSYYSYSPDTPTTILGNRCGSEHQIRLDKTNPDRYTVKAQVFFTCTSVCYPIDDHSVRPADNSPIAILGLEQTGTLYRVTGDELCVQVFAYLFQWDKTARTNFAGAHLEILIDTKLIASAEVDTDGNIVQRYDDQNHAVAIVDSGGQYAYCFRTNLEDGAHRIELRLQTAAHKTLTYSWDITSPAPQITAEASRGA